jgi:hypothetical protein
MWEIWRPECQLGTSRGCLESAHMMKTKQNHQMGVVAILKAGMCVGERSWDYYSFLWSSFCLKDNPKRACRDVPGYAQEPKRAQLSTPPQADNKVASEPTCTLPHFKTCGLFNINFAHKFCKKLPPIKWLQNIEQWPLIPDWWLYLFFFASKKNKTKTTRACAILWPCHLH